MKLRFLVPTLAALLAVGACKGKDKKQDSDTKPLAAVGEKAKELAKSGMPAANEAPAPDVAQTNKLWAIAPANTVMGLVAAPGAASKLHSMMMNIVATAEARPLGAKVLGELRKESKSEVIDAFDPASISGAGIDLNGAAAVFMVAKKQAYLVLPVTDREAFRKVTEGTLETVDGVEFDRIEEDLVCAPKSDRYLCASTAEMLKGFGDKVDSALAKQVAELPSEYRGHAEIVMDIPGMAKVDDDFTTDFDGQMSDPKLGIGAIRLGNGSVTIRGWFQVNPLDKLAAAVGVPNTLAASLGAKPSSMLGFRMPMDAIIAEMPDKEEKIAGLDLKKDVMGNFTGEFVGYTPQSEALWGRLAMGIKDPAPFKTLLNMGCGMAPALGIPGIKVTPGDGKCSAMVDVAKLPLPDKTIAELFEKPVSIIAEVKADRFELTLGTEAPGTDRPVSAMGSELMSKSWNFSMWAEGMGITSGATDLPWKQIPETVEAETVDGIKMGLWILAQVYEVGMAGAVRDDGIHGVFHLGTYAGDSPEAFKAYQAAVTAALASGTATAEFDAIREKWPNSMAARGGTGAGSMMITAVTGVVAAVAVPAFMKYKQESMKAAERFEEKSTAMEPVKK